MIKLKCDSLKQEKFLDYEFDTIEINNFSVKNDKSEKVFVPGETYLFPTYSAYGHSLVDVYAQFKVLQLKYKDIKPFFYEQSEKGYFFNARILKDQMFMLGHSDSKVSDISKGNYVFDVPINLNLDFEVYCNNEV